VKTWTKTKYQGLLRHRGGTYYARLYVSGKEKWLCLETQLIEIAKAKLDQEKSDLAAATKTGWEPQAGTIKGEAAIQAYREDLKLRVGIKESTRQFYEWSLKAIIKTWPELSSVDVRHITHKDCKEWAKKFSETYSATYFNNAVLVLTEVFAMAIKSGVIYKNPTTGIELKRKTPKQLVLPNRADFHKIVADIRGSGHRTAQDSGDLIEFLAYTGCPISEAQRITWGNCDLVKGILTIKGDPETGTKNWRIRQIPMIPACKKFA
jgi:site-specific recombinase XerD